MSRLPLALLALALVGPALAGPALADGMPGPAGHGYGGPRPIHRPAPRSHRLVRADAGPAPGRVALAPQAGPVYLAWPEPAEVRVPIYNRPSHLPPSW